MKDGRNIGSIVGTSALGLAMLVAAASITGLSMMAQESAPTARAVRLSSVEGQVQLSQGATVLAAQAPANAPLFEGTQITSSDDGRAEVQFEDGSVARISPNSSLTLTVLRQDGSSTDTELTLNSGLGYFELQGEAPNGRIRVKFGDSTVSANGFTVFRINLDNPPGELAVFSGNANLENNNSLALDLHGGESVRLNSADSSNYALNESIEPNSWDAWNSDRDQTLTSEEAAKTAATTSVPNSNNPAWSDLDANGNWYNVPGQGYVWSPYEAQNTGWDPYGCGSWMWTPQFGYIWVSCESWGYMPYQTGMWGYYDGLGWGWAPGLGGYWWGGGGWASNVGRAPFRYEPPHRPRGGPVRPGEGVPIRAGGRYQPYPVVAVNRLHDSNSGLSVRPRNAPIVVAGSMVQPLRPLAPRAVYNYGTAAEGSHAIVYPGTGTGVRYGYPQNPNRGVNTRQGYWDVPRAPGNPGRAPVPAYTGNYGSRAPAPTSHGSYGGGAYAGRPSGGGGGGAAHASGGGSYSGGGSSMGGGGASHAGGGGGGAHH